MEYKEYVCETLYDENEFMFFLPNSILVHVRCKIIIKFISVVSLSTKYLREIWGPHGYEYEDGYRLFFFFCSHQGEK
jgi:hypothetical protein